MALLLNHFGRIDGNATCLIWPFSALSLNLTCFYYAHVFMPCSLVFCDVFNIVFEIYADLNAKINSFYGN